MCGKHCSSVLVFRELCFWGIIHSSIHARHINLLWPLSDSVSLSVPHFSLSLAISLLPLALSLSLSLSLSLHTLPLSLYLSLPIYLSLSLSLYLLSLFLRFSLSTSLFLSPLFYLSSLFSLFSLLYLFYLPLSLLSLQSTALKTAWPCDATSSGSPMAAAEGGLDPFTQCMAPRPYERSQCSWCSKERICLHRYGTVSTFSVRIFFSCLYHKLYLAYLANTIKLAFSTLFIYLFVWLCI